MGYTGGDSPRPTYGTVCGGDGHTEAMRVEFDPAQITYEELLERFWAWQQPGPGTQYKSAIWYHDEAQREAAEKFRRERKAAATEVSKAKIWYNAEDYHQKYYSSQPRWRP